MGAVLAKLRQASPFGFQPEAIPEGKDDFELAFFALSHGYNQLQTCEDV